MGTLYTHVAAGRVNWNNLLKSSMCVEVRHKKIWQLSQQFYFLGNLLEEIIQKKWREKVVSVKIFIVALSVIIKELEKFNVQY